MPSRARHKLAIGAVVTGLAAIAAVSGASSSAIVSDSRAGGSMVMAVLPGVALLCNLGNLFVVRASNRSRPGPQ